jgi:hypothetical protein
MGTHKLIHTHKKKKKTMHKTMLQCKGLLGGVGTAGGSQQQHSSQKQITFLASPNFLFYRECYELEWSGFMFLLRVGTCPGKAKQRRGALHMHACIHTGIRTDWLEVTYAGQAACMYDVHAYGGQCEA